MAQLLVLGHLEMRKLEHQRRGNECGRTVRDPPVISAVHCCSCYLGFLLRQFIQPLQGDLNDISPYESLQILF